jgi:hypothetical protein
VILMAGRLRRPAMKTQKQVEAIEDTLTDTITKLTEDGHQEIHVLETMLGLAIAGCTHYGGARALARMFRHLADECDRCADAAVEERAAD